MQDMMIATSATTRYVVDKRTDNCVVISRVMFYSIRRDGLC